MSYADSSFLLRSNIGSLMLIDSETKTLFTERNTPGSNGDKQIVWTPDGFELSVALEINP